MIKKTFVVIIFLCVAVVAENSQNPFKTMGGFNCNYYGDINNKYKIGMSLLFEEDSISGSYFYISQLKDIKIAGNVLGSSKVQLNAIDANNRIIETFVGIIIDSTHHDPQKKTA